MFHNPSPTLEQDSPFKMFRFVRADIDKLFQPCVQVPHTCYFCNPQYCTRGSSLLLSLVLNWMRVVEIDITQVEKPWPLYIEDNSGRSHNFVLKPGRFSS